MIFLPVFLYILLFVMHGLAVTDFHDGSSHTASRDNYLIALIGNTFVLPGVAVLQLIYGICLKVRHQNPDGELHMLSAALLLGLAFFFIASMFSGNVITV